MEQNNTHTKRERILALYKALGGTTYIAARLGVNNSTLYQAKIMERGIPPKFYMGLMQLAREFRDQGHDIAVSITMFDFVVPVPVSDARRRPIMRPEKADG